MNSIANLLTSDVYIVESDHPRKDWECLGCSLRSDDVILNNKQMLKHLEKHQKRGDYVPQKAFEEIKKKME